MTALFMDWKFSVFFNSFRCWFLRRKYIVRRPWSAIFQLLMMRSEIRMIWPCGKDRGLATYPVFFFPNFWNYRSMIHFDKLTMKIPIYFASKAMYICLVVVWSVTPCVFRAACTVRQRTRHMWNYRDTLCREDLRSQITFDNSSLSMKYFLFACVLILPPSALGRNNCHSQNNVNISSLITWTFRQEISSWILRNVFFKDIYCTERIYRVFKEKLRNCFFNKSEWIFTQWHKWNGSEFNYKCR